MAFHGKDSVIKVDNSSGTLQDISADVTNVAFSRQNDIHDTTAYGQSGHTFIAGLTNGKITITGWADYAATTGSLTVLDGLVGHGTTTASTEYGPNGSTTGKTKYTCETVLESLDVSDPVADLVSFVAVLQITGAVTEGTYA